VLDLRRILTCGYGFRRTGRTRGIGLRIRCSYRAAALRQLANRLVGILHGCLKTRTLHNEAIAWPTPDKQTPTAA